MNDQRLRELYAERLRRTRPADRSACVAPERLRLLAEGGLAEDDATAALDHVMACAACRDEFELLRSLASARPAPARSAPRRLAIAASFMLVVAAAAVWQATRQRSPDLTRGDAVAVELVEPAARAGAPLLLTWHGLPTALRYEVEVLDTAGALLHAVPTRDTTVTVPETLGLERGTDYRWWVRAILADGREVASAVETFRVR